MYEKPLRCKQGGADIPMVSLLKTVKSAHYMSTTLVARGTYNIKVFIGF